MDTLEILTLLLVVFAALSYLHQFTTFYKNKKYKPIFS